MATHEKVEMCEGVEGVWSYHLRTPGNTKALCGHRVMSTHAPMSSWGYRGHLNERYCERCKALA